jgi:hypothetical protein
MQYLQLSKKFQLSISIILNNLFMSLRGVQRRSNLICLAAIMFGTFMVVDVYAQTQPELETALMKIGRVWAGVTANGGKSSFDYRAGFFPNDYDVIGLRGQQQDAWVGAGFRLTRTNWIDPIDTLHAVAVYGPLNEFMPQGKVIVPMENFVRYKYPEQVVNYEPVDLPDFGVHDPSQFGDYTYDQIVEVTTENIIGVQVHRRIMVWSQNLNDDYIITDVVFTNVTNDTLKSFYINVESNGQNSYRSNGSNPYPTSGERYNTATTWQHYYGGRVGDTLRVFYEYSADDADKPNDNMGAPVSTQDGRLINQNFCWYSILHASESPYSNEQDDIDDFLQPKVTYIGKSNLIPYTSEGDEFGDNNYWAIRGEYSRRYPMIGNTWPGTFHGLNSDEQGSAFYYDHPAGTNSNNNSKLWSSFGPYTFPPGEKVHLVYASGFSGLDIELAQNIGKEWLSGTLKDPPGLPDAEKGYFPANFVYPLDATEVDKIKDRWLSTGIDSVMKSAWRAKWNFDHDYKIPMAPPPPETITITGLGTGVEIRWSDPGAEEMSSFAGYRIMRRVSNRDTVFYETTYSSGPEDKATDHLYVDKDVLVGAEYYYYIQAKAQIAEDDLLADPLSRGKIIYSSRVLHPNIAWINPPRFSQEDLAKIRIVPNPYNINDPLLEEQGWFEKRGIQFFNLPNRVTIKIFTENGDLVQTIEHDGKELKVGSLVWNMITSSQQVISSGVYIVVFEKPSGEISYQKFVVVR